MNNHTQQSILNIIRACDSVMLATVNADGYPEARHLTNAMNRDAADLNLYFMTGRDTPKFAQLARDARCGLYYFDPNTRHAVRLFGTIEFVADMALRAAYWRDEYARFGYNGAGDENFVLMRFVPRGYKYYVGPEMHSGRI